MKKVFSVTALIQKPVINVWKYFIDIDTYGTEWMPGIESISKVTEGDVGVDTVFEFQARDAVHKSRVTEYKEEKQLTLASEQGNVKVEYKYLFTPQSNGTKVLLEAFCEFKGFTKIMAPFISSAIRKADLDQLKNLRSKVEK